METGLVSVLIPTFNSARWVGEALDSVRRQTDTGHELIVADNGSTDDTLSIVRETAPEARVVHAAQRGPSSARNAALEVARGEFIQFLDSDDLLDPTKLEVHRAAMAQSGADVVWGGFARLYRNESGVFDREVIFRPCIGDDVSASLLRGEGFLPLGATLIRRSPRTIAVRFDTDFRIVEDIRYLQGLSLAGARFQECTRLTVGFWLREHDAPTRASAISAPQFWSACAANAEAVYRHWIRTGEPVGKSRVEALFSVWFEAAEILAIHGDQGHEHVLELLKAIDPNYLRRLRFPHRFVAPVIGYRRTIALAQALKSIRGRILGGQVTVAGST